MGRSIVRPNHDLGIHSCGDVNDILDDYIELGVQIFHPPQEEAMGIARVKAIVGDRLTFRGGIGVQHVLPWGSPGDVQSHEH